MLLRKLSATALILGTLLVNSSAHALTIDADEYTKILSFTTKGDFGYWKNGKYFTFNHDDNYGMVPIGVKSVTYADADLTGTTIKSVSASGATNGFEGPVTMGVVNLFGANNVLLLTAQLVPEGTLTTIRKRGAAGQLDVSALYEVTGGSLFTSGLISGSLYIDIAFDYVWQNEVKDLKVKNGTFTFYERHGAPNNNGGNNGGNNGNNNNTEVPEPATLALLASSLLGGARLRRKAAK